MFESMTKELLREQLEKGLSIGQILKLREGQDCTIYKADHFSAGDTIMYIPDFEANCLPFGTNLSIAQITYILSRAYTGKYFVEECNGDEAKAKDVWEYVDWQHPSAAHEEMLENDWWDEKDGTETVSETAIPASKIVSVLAGFREHNKGDAATELLLDSVLAELLEIGQEEAFAMLSKGE